MKEVGMISLTSYCPEVSYNGREVMVKQFSCTQRSIIDWYLLTVSLDLCMC